MDMEELRRRRLERQERRQRQIAQRRWLLIRLGIALAILIAVAVLIFTVGRRPGTDAPGNSAPATQPTTRPTLATESTLPPVSVVRITAVGDLNVTDRVLASGGADYDFTNTFLDVLPVLADSQITLVNLEGTFCGAPYGGEDRSAPTSLAAALAKAGVDLVQTANSYAIKKGVSTLAMTQGALRASGLEGLGAYATEEEAEKTGGFTLCRVDGVTVAFVALTKGMDGMALPAGSEKCVNLLYKDYATNYHQVDEEGITALLRRVEKQKPDIVVALVHWGSEYNDTHSETQTKIKDLLLENGVDAIIGTHPHFVQPVEFDRDKGTVVAYSLGDFLGDAQRSGTEYSIALHLEITKEHATGSASITDCSYTPLFTLERNGLLQVVRLEQAMAAYEAGAIGRVSKETYDAMAYALERIQARTKPE